MKTQFLALVAVAAVAGCSVGETDGVIEDVKVGVQTGTTQQAWLWGDAMPACASTKAVNITQQRQAQKVLRYITGGTDSSGFCAGVKTNADRVRNSYLAGPNPVPAYGTAAWNTIPGKLWKVEQKPMRTVCGLPALVTRIDMFTDPDLVVNPLKDLVESMAVCWGNGIVPFSWIDGSGFDYVGDTTYFHVIIDPGPATLTASLGGTSAASAMAMDYGNTAISTDDVAVRAYSAPGLTQTAVALGLPAGAPCRINGTGSLGAGTSLTGLISTGALSKQRCILPGQVWPAP